MKTIRLFDENSHLYIFTATVLSSEPSDDPHTLRVILDKTAFFPEGGGQYADPGMLADCPVVDVKEIDGVITHIVDVSHFENAAYLFTPGTEVTGVLDASTRLVRMQNHTAEHILSGIIHHHFGFSNVGFHLGNGDVTLDFDGVLTREQLDEVEDEANAIITSCLPVTAYYPASDELSAMTYRAKLDLTENVRIVEIGTPDAPIDRCACCAPHVTNTGEIGMVKLLDFMHYKGGIRIHMLAGTWALLDYRRRYAETAAMAAAMSVKQADVLEGFECKLAEIDDHRHTIAALRGKVQTLTLTTIQPTKGSLCLFDEGLEAVEMRKLLNAIALKCGRFCGVFVGNDQDGYRFVIGRGDDSLDLRAYAKDMNIALSARGGGSSKMLQGSSTASRAVIEAYFAKI